MARRPDISLSPKELAKRASKWKDNTLVNKLRSVGIEVYQPKTRKRIRGGGYHIPQKRRRELERLYEKRIKAMQDDIIPIDVVDDFDSVDLPLSPRDGWYTTSDWVANMQLLYPALDGDFSTVRLTMNELKYVYVEQGIPAFCNKRLTRAPRQPNPETQFVVYFIMIDSANDMHLWIQTSQKFYYGPDPLGSTEREFAKIDVDAMQEANIEHDVKSKNRYTWWKDNPKSSAYQFIGIGVVL